MEVDDDHLLRLKSLKEERVNSQWGKTSPRRRLSEGLRLKVRREEG